MSGHFTVIALHSLSEIKPSMNTDDEKTPALSRETILKIQELKRLDKYSQYYRNPYTIIKCATYWSINGDNMILDEMLEKLHMIGTG